MSEPILTARELKGIPKWLESMEKAGAAWETRQYIVPLLKALERVQGALPDPNGLELLADWFDSQQAANNWNGTEVQDDLRRWAENSRQALRDTGWEVTDGKA